MMEAREGRPLLLVDLAVPRDIDPACARGRRRDAAGHGRAAGAGARAPRACAGPRPCSAEAIVEDEIQTFAGWLGRLEVLPTLTALRSRGDAVVDGAAGRERGAAGSRCRERDAARVEALARAVVKRLLHEPTARVRELDAEHRHARLSLLRELFGLEEAAAAEAGRGRRGPPAARVTTLRLGTRGSALALAQARSRSRALLGGEVELVKITTAGDVDRARGDKSRWVGALEAALLAGEIDLAVHSAKDVPGRARAGHRDRGHAAARGARSTCCRCGWTVREGARVGTSALRRRAQLLAARPDLEVVEIRGNVDTRLAKRAAGEVDVLVLAAAGLDRLGAAARRARMLHRRRLRPGRGPGRDRGPGAGGHRRCADASTTPPPTPRWTPSATSCARSEATCHTPVGVLVAGRARARVRRAAGRLGVDRRRGRLRRRSSPGACCAAGAVELLRAVSRVTVFLVGAGPGDPGLLTVRARELIATADVILYDRLIPPGALDGARPTRSSSTWASSGGGPQMPQEEIDRLLVQYGTGGRRVVRLKGGDPFVFGRGGEEAQVLRAAGIPFEVVPGITAGIAAPAYAGIPVTHRELASGVAFVTGHEDPASRAATGPALARVPGDARLLHGREGAAADRRRSWSRAGAPPDEPVAVVERGTLPGQRTVVSTLARRGRATPRASARRRSRWSGRSPALREQIAWLEPRPLFGRTVAVTRARAQASRAGRAAARAGRRRSSRRRRSARSRSSVTLPPVRDYDLLCVTSPDRRRRAVHPPARRARRWRA